MDAASCGPSSALQSMSKYSQRDTSLQKDVVGHPSQGHVNEFRSQQAMDPYLANEFQEFQRGESLGTFRETPMAPGVPKYQMNVNRGMYDGDHQHFQHQNQWVLDFSRLNLDTAKTHSGQTLQRSSKGDWKDAFLSQVQQQGLHQSFEAPRQYFLSHIPPRQYHANHSGLRNYTLPNTLGMLEHQELHRRVEEERQFEEEFDKLEQELEGEGIDQNDELLQQNSLRHSNDEFAAIASKVERTMRENKNKESSEKFQNSSFLKLMNAISNRSVELSENGKDLVEVALNQGNTPSSNSPTPDQYQEGPQLRTDSFIPQQSQMSQMDRNIPSDPVPTGSHLPDPLAHLKDNDLAKIMTPLQAAKVVSGNQVSNSDWLEDPDWSDQPNWNNMTPRLDFDEPKPYPRGRILSELQEESYYDYRNDDDAH